MSGKKGFFIFTVVVRAWGKPQSLYSNRRILVVFGVDSAIDVALETFQIFFLPITILSLSQVFSRSSNRTQNISYFGRIICVTCTFAFGLIANAKTKQKCID